MKIMDVIRANSGKRAPGKKPYPQAPTTYIFPTGYEAQKAYFGVTARGAHAVKLGNRLTVYR
jgi:hypothetical protein